MEPSEVFLQMVLDRGARLRRLSFSRLSEMTNEPTEEVVVNGRKGNFSTIVEPCEDGRLLIVVQGFLRFWSWLPKFENVAVDGFYKHPDDSVTELSTDELLSYD